MNLFKVFVFSIGMLVGKLCWSKIFTRNVLAYSCSTGQSFQSSKFYFNLSFYQIHRVYFKIFPAQNVIFLCWLLYLEMIKKLIALHHNFKLHTTFTVQVFLSLFFNCGFLVLDYLFYNFQFNFDKIIQICF